MDIKGKLKEVHRYYEMMQLGCIYEYKNELDEIVEQAGLYVERYGVSDINNQNYFL